jgi:hypothetical protein
MDRAHYRRFTPSRVYKDDAAYERESSKDAASVKKHGKFCERLVTQFIVCGVIMMAILVLNLLDTPFTQNLGQSILSAVRGQTTVQEVRDTWTKAKHSVQGLFGDPIANSKSGDAGTIVTQAIAETPPSNLSDESNNSNEIANFRIDEDILSQLQANASSSSNSE